MLSEKISLSIYGCVSLNCALDQFFKYRNVILVDDSG